MRKTILWMTLWLGTCLAAAMPADARHPLEKRPKREIGVVVEEVTSESLGARAGLQVDDLLLSWCRAAASPNEPCLAEGRFESPFDFEEMELEEAPRGDVRILGKRAAVSTTWVLLPGSQSIKVRLVLPEDLHRLYQEGRSLSAAKRLDAAIERWRSAALAANRAGEGRLGVWFLLRAAGALAEAQQWPRADALYKEATEQVRHLGAAKLDALIAKTWGKTYQRRGSWQEAEGLYHNALDLDQRMEPQGLAVAWDLHTLGTTAAQHSDLQQAEAYLREALAIRERLAPRSFTLAATLMNLGNVTYLQGDLAEAEGHLRRVVSTQEALAPASAEVAGALLNLGNVVGARGNLAEAEELYRRAKTIYEKINPESLEMAKALKNLADAATARHDEETAEYFLKRALALEERLDLSGTSLAITLRNVGLQALDRGDLIKAEEYFRRAMNLTEKVAPNSLGLANNLDNLALIALRRRDCATAEVYFQRAFTIRQRLIPDSLAVSESLWNLGSLDLECQDLPQAEDNYRRALAIQERLAPGTQAISLHGLGEVYKRQGRSLAAEESFCRAAEVAETQQKGKGTAEAYDEKFFTDCLAARIEIGKTTEAFHVLEKGRARAFLKQLAERDLLFSADLPEEMSRRRRELDRQLENTQGTLARLSSTRDSAEVERLLDRLREIRDQKRELTVQIRNRSPRLASLQYPEPLDLAGVRRTLDPGTALLAYAIGEDKSYLLVVHPPELPDPGLSAFTLPLGEKALREAVGSFRSLLQNPHSDSALVDAQARELYDLLIKPAEARIAPAKRLLISADGPLYTLPFAALVRRGRYLIEWKPVHFVLSATVYAELKKARRPSTDSVQKQVIAFGDPAYPKLPQETDTAPGTTLEVLAAVRRGLSLKPLPATRQEVEGIAKLFPQAQTYLGRDATEERAKSLGPEPGLVHFACHGLLDERFPLNSALALTIPEHPAVGQDNGLLQAWEIFESVRLNADLVTLSACDTALGKEMGGEGLVGLTRAFQYAGARSVLASLWSLSDVSTARFMKRFYGYLRSGKPNDEALQAAQIDQIRGKPGSPHPFYWAAFELSGDWR